MQPIIIRMKTPIRILMAAIASFTLANAAEEPVKITVLSTRPHPEHADKEIIVKPIELQPEASAPPHMHPGMVTGYVESGKLEFQLKDCPLLKLKAGDTFLEPPGSHHMLARNPDSSAKTVIIAFVINPKGAPLSTPLEHHEGGKKE